MDTSWSKVAGWYDDLLEGAGHDDTYQAKVILPNILRLLGLGLEKNGDKNNMDNNGEFNILDLACGQGYFSRAFVSAGQVGGTGGTGSGGSGGGTGSSTGAGRAVKVTGVDAGASLIKIAESLNNNKLYKENITYHVSPADSLPFLKDKSFDAITIIEAIQNIRNYQETFKECSRLIKDDGRIFIVMNHPSFRIPKHSDWSFDPKKNVQFRRIEEYLSESTAEIDMAPSIGSISEIDQVKPVKTISFHRPLQAYSKALQKSGLAIARIEEWPSHRKSQKGPRENSENRSRNEIPLFMMLEVIKI